jgi:hypothetical protein
MRVLNQTAFEAEVTVDAIFNVAKDSGESAHAAGFCDGTVFLATGEGVTATLSSPLCTKPGTAYAWCDTVKASLGPIQGPGNENSGDLLITFNGDVAGLHLEVIGLDVVEIKSYSAAGALLEIFRHTVSNGVADFLGIVPGTNFRSIRLNAKRNVEWAVTALKVLKGGNR